MTAEEFAKYQLTMQHVPHFDRTIFKGSQMKEMMIGFAKLHVKAALEAAHSNMQLPKEDLEFTLSSYPLNQIK